MKWLSQRSNYRVIRAAGGFLIMLGLTLFILLGDSRDIVRTEVFFIKSDVSIDAHVVESQSDRALGLSIYDELESDRGMLFIFSKKDKHGFWMKDMKFPIDIIWLDETKRIVWIEQKVQPASYPKVFTPPSQALYVIETVEGYTDYHRISVGDYVSFEE